WYGDQAQPAKHPHYLRRQAIALAPKLPLIKSHAHVYAPRVEAHVDNFPAFASIAVVASAIARLYRNCAHATLLANVPEVVTLPLAVIAPYFVEQHVFGYRE